MVCQLDITPPVGWLQIATEDPAVILQHLHSTTRASAQVHSYCLRGETQVAGAAIALKKNINGHDADQPPGPKFAAGDQVPFEFHVTNTGSVALTGVTVTDDAGLQVSCPKSALDAGESMTCTATGTAEGCINLNIATATGTTAGGTRVNATDVAYYTGIYAPALELRTLVNGDDANDPAGPVVATGELLHWTFVVTNNGNIGLNEIAVATGSGLAAACPKTSLDPQESMTCTAESPAKEGQQHEVGKATGVEHCGSLIEATDPAWYTGRLHAPAIEIEKLIGENDADTPPGPTLPVGVNIKWQFVVTNTGNVPLTGIAVTDDHGLVVTCVKTALDPGEATTCYAGSLSLPCQQSNTATVTATAGTQTVTDSDAAYYFGQGHPTLILELSVNGDPADATPGPSIAEGSTVLLTYAVTNNGDVELTGVHVSDDRDRPGTCPKTALQPGESMTCTASFLAAAGSFDLTGSAYANPPCGDPLRVDDPAFYVVPAATPAIELVKTTNGVHYQAAPGPTLLVGTVVQWAYTVTNSGNVALTNVSVTDSGGVAVTCPKNVLEPGESMACTASGVAAPCQYTNSATATGQPPAGTPVSATDESFYFGEHHAAVSFEKRLNGYRHPAPPGPTIMAGATIYWSFVVTNTGDAALAGINVTDTDVSGVACPKTTLAPGESMTCTASSPAVRGQQQNTASVTAQPPCGDAVSGSDTAYYVAVMPGIAFQKLVNGSDADDAAHAVQLLAGDLVLWTFVVTNSGDITLQNIFVTDDQGVAVTCPRTSLAPSESMTCTASGVAVLGSYCNTATASGTTPQSLTLTASDSACYFASKP